MNVSMLAFYVSHIKKYRYLSVYAMLILHCVSSRSRFGIFSLSPGRHPAAHVVSVGHPFLLHANDARIGQPGNSCTRFSVAVEEPLLIKGAGCSEPRRDCLESTLSSTGC